MAEQAYLPFIGYLQTTFSIHVGLLSMAHTFEVIPTPEWVEWADNDSVGSDVNIFRRVPCVGEAVKGESTERKRSRKQMD